MENSFVNLLDNRGRILWHPETLKDIQRRPLFEFIHPEDRPSAEARLADTLIRGQVSIIVARWNSPHFGAIVGRTTLHPTDSTLPVAIVAVHQILPEAFADLSEQDTEILSLLANDMGVNEIAVHMDRSNSTIDSRVRNLKAKLGQKTLHGLVGAALRWTLLPLELPRLVEEASQLREEVHDVE